MAEASRDWMAQLVVSMRDSEEQAKAIYKDLKGLIEEENDRRPPYGEV